MGIYQKVIDYCSSNDMSISAFEKKCGIGNGVVGRWKDDESQPSMATLQKIQSATKIPIKKWIS